MLEIDIATLQVQRKINALLVWFLNGNYVGNVALQHERYENNGERPIFNTWYDALLISVLASFLPPDTALAMLLIPTVTSNIALVLW